MLFSPSLNFIYLPWVESQTCYMLSVEFLPVIVFLFLEQIQPCVETTPGSHFFRPPPAEGNGWFRQISAGYRQISADIGRYRQISADIGGYRQIPANIGGYRRILTCQSPPSWDDPLNKILKIRHYFVSSGILSWNINTYWYHISTERQKTTHRSTGLWKNRGEFNTYLVFQII